MTTPPTPDVRRDRPIGYWLKHIDRGIETGFARLLAAHGLNRRGWQVLNTLARAPATRARLDAALAPFLTDDEPTVAGYADTLVTRGHATYDCDGLGDGGTYALTAAGRDTHARVAALVHAQRARVIAGLTPEDYTTLLRLLRRIATNLDTPEHAPPP